MTYPILEYDSTPLAFIEPSQVIQPRDVPEACVICFFQEVIDKVVAVHQAQRLEENRWEDGPHPILLTHDAVECPRRHSSSVAARAAPGIHCDGARPRQ